MIDLIIKTSYWTGSVNAMIAMSMNKRERQAYKARLAEAGIKPEEVTRIWQNYKGSVNQAAYVLGSFRRNASDVHGKSESSAALVRHAIDCGTFIIRSITSELNVDAQQLDVLDF